MIAVRALRVERGGREILHGVDLDVPRGTWCALIGPNGAGKSTLLRALAGGDTAGGVVTLDGQPVRDMGHRARAQRIAVVEQQPTVPAGMTVADYVALGRTPYISYFGREGADDRRVVDDSLERLDLRGLAGRPVSTLSGGEWQRTVLARGLAQQPDVLLLDEPTSALDLGRQLHALELVDDLRAGDLTVISATHDLGLAAAFSDTVALMSHGAIVADGVPGDVLTEEILSRHYGAGMRVLRDDEGHLAVVPRRTRA